MTLMEYEPMKMLAAALGAATAIALLSGCAYKGYDRYAYGYGYNGNANPNGSFYGDRSYRTYDGSYYHNCWVDQSGARQCTR
jgi:hypothetical protein